MPHQTHKTVEADMAAHADSFSNRVDVRSALTLARVALQTLADLDPGAASSIDHALDHEIETARAENDPAATAVIAILSEVRARLTGDEPGVGEKEQVWYIE